MNSDAQNNLNRLLQILDMGGTVKESVLQAAEQAVRQEAEMERRASARN